MHKTMTSWLLFVLSLVSVNLHAAMDYVPEVYTDDYVTVRSGIPEAGSIPIHFGDAMTLVVELEFPADEVTVEAMDEQFFERSWGSEKGINLIGQPESTRTETESGRTLLRGLFHFQVLDCPGDETSCRGNKLYEVPIFTIGYQIIDSGGKVVNTKSIRFRPDPAELVVMQSLNIVGDGSEKLEVYFGGGGYPRALELGDVTADSTWAIVLGGLLFLTSFIRVKGTGVSTGRVEHARRSSTRWQKAMEALADTDMTDDVWADMLRRSVVWYIQDEFGVNPYSWLYHGPRHEARADNPELRELFVEVLNQETIAADRRRAYLERLNAATGTAGAAAAGIAA